MQLTVNQIETANVQQVSEPKAGAIKQAFDSLLKETFTPGWKKWKRKYYAMLIVDCSLRKGVEMHFPLLFVETEEEKIEKFLLKEFQKWQFHDKLSIRTRELLGEILDEEELEDAHKIARNSWWEYIDKTRTSEMTTQEISTLALAKSGNNSKKALEVATNIQKEHVAPVTIPQSFEEDLLDAMKPIIDGINSSLVEEIEVIEVTQVTEITQTEVIEVVAEILPIEETVVLNTTPLTDAELIKLRQAMTGQISINKLTIPNLRLYAKARSIHVPGSTTKVKAIRNIIATAQRGSTKLVKI